MNSTSCGLLALVIVISGCSVAGEDVPLYIGCMLPMTGRHAFWAAGIYPAIELARRHVNNRSDIMPGYQLEFQLNDTKSEEGVVVRSFIEQIQNEQKNIAIMCEEDSDDSAGCRLLYEVGRFWNPIQISSMASTGEFSDRQRFPNFFRTRIPLVALNEVAVALLKYFNWNRVSLLDIDEESFHPSAEILLDDFEKANITLVQAGAMTSKVDTYMTRLKALNGRIIVAFFDSPYDKPKVYCEAFKAGVVAPKYVWIAITEHLPTIKWWGNATLHNSAEEEEEEDEDETEDDTLSCTPEELAKAAEGTLVIDAQILGTDDMLSVSQQTQQEFLEAYDDIREEIGGYPFTDYAPFAYDAIWAVTLAINDTITGLPAGQSLEDFGYNSAIKYQIFSAMSRVRFQGMSGRVAFEGADRKGQPLAVYQVQDGEYILRGVYNTDEKVFRWTSDVRWDGGNVPVDDLRVFNVLHSITPGFFIGVCVVASLGVLLSVVFLVYNVINRNKRHIKLSSPRLNNVIIIGGILVYITTILFGLQQTEVVCQARAWTLAVGFTLTFGAIFSKTWRVHIIFTNKTAQSKKILDRHLFVFVLVFLFVDVVILTAWTTIDPLKPIIEHLPYQMDKNGEDFATDSMIVKCVSKNQLAWLATMYSYKGLLLLLGVFLAWETRKVHFQQLNDSQYIGASAYIVSILAIFGIPTIMTLRPDQCDLVYGIEAFCLVFSTTVTLCLVFVPKIITTRKINTGEIGTDIGLSIRTLDSRVNTFQHSCGSCRQAEAELKELRHLCNHQEPADVYVEAAARAKEQMFIQKNVVIRSNIILPDYGDVYGADMASPDI